MTDRQRSTQPDTGHHLLCGKPYELFLVCLQTVYGGRGVCVGGAIMCGWQCGRVPMLWLSLTLQVGSWNTSKIPFWVIAASLYCVHTSVLMSPCVAVFFFINLHSLWWVNIIKKCQNSSYWLHLCVLMWVCCSHRYRVGGHGIFVNGGIVAESDTRFKHD